MTKHELIVLLAGEMEADSALSPEDAFVAATWVVTNLGPVLDRLHGEMGNMLGFAENALSHLTIENAGVEYPLMEAKVKDLRHEFKWWLEKRFTSGLTERQRAYLGWFTDVWSYDS